MKMRTMTNLKITTMKTIMRHRRLFCFASFRSVLFRSGQKAMINTMMIRMTMMLAFTGQNSTTPSSSSSHQVRRRVTTWTTTWSCRTTTAAATCSPPSSKTPPAATTTSMASHCWMSKIFPFGDSTSASV